MAKLQTYKFVNPGVSTTKSPTVAAARKQTLALNRLGGTISSIGMVVSDIEKISIRQIKNDKLRAKAERRRDRRELDQAVEEEVENKKVSKQKPKLTRSSLKIAKGGLSWIEKFLAPIGKFLGFLAKIAITKSVLEWVSNPANQKKLADFLEKTHFVFKKIFGWAAGFTNNILDGFSSLTDPNGTFAERLGGVGNIMKGLIGLKYLMNPFSIISDIIGLVDLLGGGDFKNPKKPKNYNNKPSQKNPSGADPNIDGPRGRLKAKTIINQFGDAAGKQYKKILAEYGDDAARAYANALSNSGGDATKAFKAWKRLNLKPVKYKPTKLQKAGDFFTGLFDKGVQKGKDAVGSVTKSLKNLPAWAGEQYSNLSKGAQRQWDNVVKASNAIADKGSKWATAAGNKFNAGVKNLSSGAQKYLTEKVLDPIKPIIEPIGKKAKAIGQGLIDMLMKIPGMDKAAEVLRKKGISGFEGIAKAGSKLGKRAAAILPVVGGLVNLFFSYQRFSQGDSIGGLIEGTSGILDVFGLATGGATSVLSMLMDGYMFVRDFVPQLQQGEEAVVDAIGARGFKDSIDKVLSKLPGLGTIVNTLMSPFKDEEEGEKKEKKKAWWDVAGVFTGKDKKAEPLPEKKQTEEIKKNQWWDFLDLFPNRKEKPQDMFLGGLWKGIKKIGGGIINTVGKVVNNPIVQIGAQFIPGAGPILAGLNMVASGNPLGALSMIPGVGGVVGQVQNFMASPWGQVASNALSGNWQAAITGGISQFSPKWGSIAGDVMGGNYLGALNTFNPKWGGIASDIMNGNYGGALSAFNPEMGAMVTKGMAMIDSFRQDPMGLISSIAEQQGMGGVLKAVTGLFGGGDKITAMTQIAAEMGIDPKILGAVKSTHQQALSEGGISAEYAMEQAMEFIPIPTIIEKIVPIPQAVAINTGGNTIVVTAPNSLLERMK